MAYNKRHNFYAIGKALIGSEMRLDNWWKKEYDLDQLRHDLGLQALKNGVQFALDNGEEVPVEVRQIVGLS